jgi:Ca2+-binding RTX toxin-like protein
MSRLSAVSVALATAALAVLSLGALSLSPAAPAARAAAPVMCQGEVATIVGTPGDDTLTGTTAPDVIAGLGGDDTIESGGGFDRICGGQGADTISADPASTNYVFLDGGRGDDHLTSAVHFAHFDGGPGDDVESSSGKAPTYLSETGTNTFTSTADPASIHASFQKASSGVKLDLVAGTATFAGSSTTFAFAPGTEWSVRGSRHDDRLKGSAGPDVLAGGGGNDLVEGRGGDDKVAGNGGRNTLRGGAGADLLRFHTRDHVYGAPGTDVLTGRVGFGRQVLSGGRGTNALGVSFGPVGHRPRYRHALVDLARGRVEVDGHVVRFSGSFIQVLAKWGAATWTLKGTGGPDVLISVSGRPAVERGRAGDDVLITAAGDDVLDGGPGTDEGDAGKAGKDTCISIEKPRFPPRRHTGCEIVH